MNWFRRLFPARGIWRPELRADGWAIVYRTPSRPDEHYELCMAPSWECALENCQNFNAIRSSPPR